MKSEPQSFVKTKKNDAFSVFVLILAESFLLFFLLFGSFLPPFFLVLKMKTEKLWRRHGCTRFPLFDFIREETRRRA